jgi:hypothetical protein
MRSDGNKEAILAYNGNVIQLFSEILSFFWGALHKTYCVVGVVLFHLPFFFFFIFDIEQKKCCLHKENCAKNK